MIKMMTMLIAFTAISSFAMAQSQRGRKISPEIFLAFHQKYPEADQVRWRDSLALYNAYFTLGNTAFTASFSASGIWQQTTTSVPFTDVPLSVKMTLLTGKYSDWEKENIALQIVYPSDPVTYRIGVNNNGMTKRYLLITIDGVLVKDQPGK